MQRNLNETPKVSLGTDTYSTQLLSALNQARATMSSVAKFPWDYYVGSIITTEGVTDYPLTPYTTQLCGTTRGVDNATVTNATVSKRQAVGYDGTKRMDRVTATTAAPVISKPTLTLESAIDGIATASVWLKEGTTAPTSVSFRLKNSGGTVLATTTATPGALTRISVSAYTTQSQGDTFTCELLWTENATDVLVDGWQIEVSDYATEYIDNTSASPKVRTEYALGESIYAVGPYDYALSNIYNRWYWNNRNITPQVPMYNPNTLGGDQLFNIQNDKLILSGTQDPTHTLYVAAKAPPIWTAGADIIDVPAPDHWLLIQGAVAFLKTTLYDIGSNTAVVQEIDKFKLTVVDLMRRKSGWRGYEVLPVVSPVFGR